MRPLEDIGFYTLCDERVKQLDAHSPMWRCEIILTDRCNFNCTYCRGLREDIQGDMPIEVAERIIDLWAADGLRNLRFSGGEPLLYAGLDRLVTRAQMSGVQRIAISTNGSMPLDDYLFLVNCGVNDFSISLDACCAADCGVMSGTNGCKFNNIENNIRELSKVTYVTVGVVLTEQNAPNVRNIVEYAHGLGVADIRIIPAAQNGKMIEGVEGIGDDILNAHPILRYRVDNIKRGRPVRSIEDYDSPRCFFPIDDSVVAGNYHFPCVIYLREGGDPIGEIGERMRQDRIEWSEKHRPQDDPICSKNCLDVCVDHNNSCALKHELKHPGMVKHL